MNKCNTIVRTAVISALSLGIASSVASAAEQPKAEKCYGVAKAGKNDCQTKNNACAGQVSHERQADAWIFVPTGTCERISGGNLEPKKS